MFPCLTVAQLESKVLPPAELEEDENFTMFLFGDSGRGSPFKPHGLGYLGMSFEEFADGFDLADEDLIMWSTSPSSLTNGDGLHIWPMKYRSTAQ